MTGIWQPRTITTEEFVKPGPTAALAALFDDQLPTPQVGDALPPLWHWAALAHWPVSSDLGTEGHTIRDGNSFLPPVDLPRRMFAGGSAEFLGALRVGDTVRRVARVESVTEKQGRSGRLVVVVVSIELYAPDGTLAVVEKQTIIYREAGVPTERAPDVESAAVVAPEGPPLQRHGPDSWRLWTDPTLLMRFSSATANPHRIHYDWPYATRVERYPGLVVHGPLMTLAAAEVHRLSKDPRPIAALSHRNCAPLFCGTTAELRPTPTAAGTTIAVLSHERLGSPETIHTRLDLTLA
ncbi:MAG: MaoC family dehydratase N-terminal domain-containing protein [Gordonia sp. (in: high G+C Gram-positive bacteria)]|uniref:FAS1-like dehydratase domain-containing protein n=1 Tax=Gordonia sp. (in: high G+C Gram-positive bacteria) TaxID=84139 RepID=UPI003BB6C4FB